MTKSVNKQTILILTGILFLVSGCKPLPIRSSKYVENEAQIKEIRKDLPFSYYHPDSQIRYDIYNSDSLLFIRFDVASELSIRKIFSFGLEIYIDTVGKKKKDEGFIYPTAGAVRQNTVLSPQTGPGIPDKSSLNDLQKNLNPMLTVIHNNEEENTNLFSKDSPLSIRMSLSKDGSLSYQAAIPLAEFGLNDLPAGQEFTIGILTGDMPEPDEDTGSPNTNMQNSYNNTSPYSGTYNNTGYQPGYTGRPNQAQPMNNNYRKELEPVSIWIKASLSSANMKYE